MPSIALTLILSALVLLQAAYAEDLTRDWVFSNGRQCKECTFVKKKKVAYTWDYLKDDLYLLTKEGRKFTEKSNKLVKRVSLNPLDTIPLKVTVVDGTVYEKLFEKEQYYQSKYTIFVDEQGQRVTIPHIEIKYILNTNTGELLVDRPTQEQQALEQAQAEQRQIQADAAAIGVLGILNNSLNPPQQVAPVAPAYSCYSQSVGFGGVTTNCNPR